MYIPTVTNVPQPSPQAQDLGQRIATTVRSYLAENPGVGSTDVTQAFMVAKQRLSSEFVGASNKAAVLVIAGVIGLLVFGLAASLYLNGGPNFRLPMITVGIAVTAIAAIVFAIARRSG